MDDRITPEARHFIEIISRFVQDECMPVEDAIEDTGRLPDPLVRTMKHLGLFGLRIPVVYGGSGMNLLDYCFALKELSKSQMQSGRS